MLMPGTSRWYWETLVLCIPNGSKPRRSSRRVHCGSPMELMSNPSVLFCFEFERLTQERSMVKENCCCDSGNPADKSLRPNQRA
ncbi:hypothetical protein CBM2629_A60161 [Cupriavidus taiwanensis]|nr:hypothetical protein CBM2629_A60161 [Cupriavidus taiwanensis]